MKMPITMLNGCDCQKTEQAVMWKSFGRLGVGRLGAVVDYDVLKIGGVEYSANQILDRTLVAKTKTPIYMNSNWKTPAYYVQPGQVIGKVYSYMKPSADRGGRSGLLFYNELGQAYYVLDESTIDTGSLKDQGAITVKQEVALEKEKEMRENDPVGYYLKKYGLPALLIIGGIVIVGGIARETVKEVVSKKLSTN